MPITIANGQTSATQAPFQQAIWVPSSAYSSYINPLWNNVEFTTGAGATGSVLDAWVETNESNTATNTLVWVNLPNGIAASSNVVIYMDFMTTNIMSASGPTGEAPNATSTYAQYDDGFQVFNLYDNFAGTTLNATKWLNLEVSGATATVDNGIVFSEVLNTAYTWLISTKQFATPQYVDTHLTSGVTNVTGEPIFQIGLTTATTLNTKEVPYDSYDLRYYGGTDKIGVDTASAHSTAASVTDTFTAGIWQFAWAATGSQVGMEGPNAISSTDSTTPIGTYMAYVGVETSRNGGISLDWISVRAYPPGGVMPGVSFGSIS